MLMSIKIYAKHRKKRTTNRFSLLFNCSDDYNFNKKICIFFNDNPGICHVDSISSCEN